MQYVCRRCGTKEQPFCDCAGPAPRAMGSGAAACARRRAARCSRHQGAEQGSAEGRLGAAGLRAPLRPPQKCRLQGVLGATKWLPPPSPEPHAAARPAREARERGQAAGPGAAGPTRGSAHSTAGARDAAAHRKRLPARRAARSRSGAPRRAPWTAVRGGLAAARRRRPQPPMQISQAGSGGARPVGESAVGCRAPRTAATFQESTQGRQRSCLHTGTGSCRAARSRRRASPGPDKSICQRIGNVFSKRS